jgi:hypothetical protein
VITLLRRNNGATLSPASAPDRFQIAMAGLPLRHGFRPSRLLELRTEGVCYGVRDVARKHPNSPVRWLTENASTPKDQPRQASAPTHGERAERLCGFWPGWP